jgi:menaquinone-dependent protoporphyrinogen oxidase
MEGRILVAYATRYGSTREVAEAVADTLRGRGAEVDVVAARDVASVDRYAAVVLGAPFYIGSMLKEATEFLERHRASLERMPVAVFALGPLKPEEMEQERVQLDRVFKKVEWLTPAAAEMFVGAYDPANLRLADKLVTIPPASPLHGLPALDRRDWDAVRAWAASLPEALGTADAR